MVSYVVTLVRHIDYSYGHYPFETIKYPKYMCQCLINVDSI